MQVKKNLDNLKSWLIEHVTTLTENQTSTES